MSADDWEPSGRELIAAANHAARKTAFYERLAKEWNGELCRLADLASAGGGHHGLQGELADTAELSRGALTARLQAWRRANGSAAHR